MNSMDSIVNSLLSSFRQVPPAAIPAMLDCILASTDSSPSSIFSTLFDEFPSFSKGMIGGSKELDFEQRNCIVSFVSAICHLLKKLGADTRYMQLLIWKIFLPLMKLVHSNDRELFNKVAGMTFGVVADTNSWGVVEVTIIPFLLRLVGLSMGEIQSEELDAYKLCPTSKNSVGRHLGPQCTLHDDIVQCNPNYLPLPVSCHILTLILDASQLSLHTVRSVSELDFDGCCADKFSAKLLWDLCNITIKMLPQSLDHRSSAITFFLPSIFRALDSHSAFEVSINGQNYILSRKNILEKLWKSCKTLFYLGPLERRDAYAILSLYMSFFTYTDEFHMSRTTEIFDLRAEKQFWDEMKKGLVDKESSVRKQSLFILKRTINLDEKTQYQTIGKTIDERSLVRRGMTKRERWAEEEAMSLGVGIIYKESDFLSSCYQKWEAFFLLYEMLEEYGTHLVEAAWNHQMTLLLHSSLSPENSVKTINGNVFHTWMDSSEEIFEWLAVLWERGFCHDNPQVRCLVMQSFLSTEWTKCNYAKLVPQNFVTGSLVEGLNDPVHNKDFGVRGVYSTWTIEAAGQFFSRYSSFLDERNGVAFLKSLAVVAKRQSFGRAGLMCLTKCISSAACGIGQCSDVSPVILQDKDSYISDQVDLLDTFRYIIESSKQHFNPSYRHQVCENILAAAASVVIPIDVPIETLLLFISSLPREITDNGGSLRLKVQEWLGMSVEKPSTSDSLQTNLKLLESLIGYQRKLISSFHAIDSFVSYDDEDLDSWEAEAKRWTRVLFLVIKEKEDLNPISKFIQDHGSNVCDRSNNLEWVPVKFLILLLSFIHELQVLQGRLVGCLKTGSSKTSLGISDKVGQYSMMESSTIFVVFSKLFFSILDALVSYAGMSCSIFWSKHMEEGGDFSGSIRGRLGGPSQRRLSSSLTSSVLQAVTSIKAVASISSWSAQFGTDASLTSAVTHLWNFCWKISSTSTACNSEIEAEICLAAYEAVAGSLEGLLSMFSLLLLDHVTEDDQLTTLEADGKSVLDSLLRTLLQNINNIIAVGNLARTRRAVLLNWKWICLELLLSIPKHALKTGDHLRKHNFYFSDTTLIWTFDDLVDSLENAGDASVLPMLRSVRLIMELLALGRKGSMVSTCHGIDIQMMWKLVRSSWILHVSCKKRRIAPIAALMSSVMHYSVFDNEKMHEYENAPGPLKWFVEKILEEGTKSPRTIRLAALHLSGLWLSCPSIIKFYMKELKLLTQYGSVAFDEDFEAELSENRDAKIEVSVLAKSPDPELTEEFINTELYARVSVAVMFSKLAEIAGTHNEDRNGSAALVSGKMFLLELLNSVVNDEDLAKELCKKYSAIHRRKVRAWQMICILSHFIDHDIVQQVTHNLHVSLYRNNFPSVRQYLETFAIHVYLNFPLLVGQELVPMLRDYNMRPQALSSYVFIAANIILHSTEEYKHRHLSELLPCIIPLLTSHHHTLRGFTQLLVHQVLQKLLPSDSSSYATMTLEEKCFQDLRSYLQNNPDCARLRASMEGYLDAFDPKKSVTPTGIFSTRVEELEFECVPATLMDQVINFLNETREDLRCSMANDAAAIKNESLLVDNDGKCKEIPGNLTERQTVVLLVQDISLDFQRKITVSKHEMQSFSSTVLLENEGPLNSLLGIEKEDQLLDQLLHLKTVAFEKLNASRQDIILVASLIDRIPNLAGLARTCEVFRASALAIADKNIVKDKQFQLISVTAEKWVPIVEVPVSSMKIFLEKKKQEGFSILGLEQTANSISLDRYVFPKRTALVLGREKEGIPVDIIHILDACIEIPQLGIVRSLNVHVSGAIALWEYTRQQRSSSC
ncbi:hypothetical protein T459_00734 [Capsicum annuum]|uniref:tRNA (guanosine(18)-2'-O)-methyltransferase TARBP1 n=1 Tax=Capsicum annuum TaxID=4072 RepID=A0A1U8GPN1_CAPAN|nr:uncharacterized protein LOC107868516 [Capsicum annuum]KAF3672281.1 TRNA/rRNA methyltransferase family protein isoform 2 [Capsicum annuum]PHT92852.1 hypothetical protein T459_00734 [Capsicum annuum]